MIYEVYWHVTKRIKGGYYYIDESIYLKLVSLPNNISSLNLIKELKNQNIIPKHDKISSYRIIKFNGMISIIKIIKGKNKPICSLKEIKKIKLY